MHFDPRTDAGPTVDAQTDPAQTLLRRFSIWEKRVEILIDFFTRIQEFQRAQSRHYLSLSDTAAKRFGGDDDFPEDGVNSISTALKEKMAALGTLYKGLGESYEETIIKGLKTSLSDIKIFKGELSSLRTTKTAEVSKRRQKFMDAVGELNVSLNRIRVPSAEDDPFVENRKCLACLHKWIDHDNQLRAHLWGIETKCAEFEDQLISKIKDTGKVFNCIVQNECGTAGKLMIDFDATCDSVPSGLDWQHFTSRDATLKAGTAQQNPAKLTYPNSKSPYVIPLMSGELYLWNKLLRRWESGAFCITRTGYLMRFDQDLSELKQNVRPRWSLNLTTTLLGDLITVKGQASFTLFADKYSYRGYGGGAKKIIKAPIRLAKNTMAQLTRVKFGASPEDAQRWYNAISAFTQHRAPEESGKKKPKSLNVGFGHRDAAQNDASHTGHSAVNEEEGIQENEVVDEYGITESSSGDGDQYETEDSWERDMYRPSRETEGPMHDHSSAHGI